MDHVIFGAELARLCAKFTPNLRLYRKLAAPGFVVAPSSKPVLFGGPWASQLNSSIRLFGNQRPL